MCKAALALALIVQAWAPIVLQVTSEDGLELVHRAGRAQGLLNYQYFNSFSLIKILEVGGLKNQESAVSLSLLRKFALGILLFMLNMEGVCASSN